MWPFKKKTEREKRQEYLEKNYCLIHKIRRVDYRERHWRSGWYDLRCPLCFPKPFEEVLMDAMDDNTRKILVK